MLKITKNEKDYLVSKGFKFGSDLHRTVKNHTYYVTESKKCMSVLNKYREKHIC